MAIRTVCFDLGGVLVRACGTFNEAVEAAGLTLRDRQYLSSPPVLDRQSHLMAAHQIGDIDYDAYCRELSSAMQGLYSADEIRLTHEAWILGEYPGASALIEGLCGDSDLVTACLSNTNDGHWARLVGGSEFPWIGRFRHRLASHLLRLAKPAPAIYKAAQDAFGCAPEQIVFFDDMSQNVDAARQMGWIAQSIDASGDPVDQMRLALAALGVPLG